MSLLFADGFDHYATADINKKWAAGTGSILPTSGRRGGGAFQGNGDNNRSLGVNAATLFTGFAFKINSLGVNAIMKLFDGPTGQITLWPDAIGRLYVTRGVSSNVNILGTSTKLLSTGIFNYIELKVTIDPTVGVIELRVNGEIWLNLTGQNTRAGTNSYANILTIGGSSQFNYDDLYCCDSSGSSNNSFLGDVRIDTLYPNGAGTNTQFTPSTGANYTCVDEASVNTTDYVSSSTVGQKDSYALTDLANTATTIKGIQVNNAVMKDDAGARSSANLIRSSTTEAQGSAFALSTSQLFNSTIHETDPATSAAWLATAINAMEAGTAVAA